MVFCHHFSFLAIFPRIRLLAIFPTFLHPSLRTLNIPHFPNLQHFHPYFSFPVPPLLQIILSAFRPSFKHYISPTTLQSSILYFHLLHQTLLSYHTPSFNTTLISPKPLIRHCISQQSCWLSPHIFSPLPPSKFHFFLPPYNHSSSLNSSSSTTLPCSIQPFNSPTTFPLFHLSNIPSNLLPFCHCPYIIPPYKPFTSPTIPSKFLSIVTSHFHISTYLIKLPLNYPKLFDPLLVTLPLPITHFRTFTSLNTLPPFD